MISNTSTTLRAVLLASLVATAAGLGCESSGGKPIDVPTRGGARERDRGATGSTTPPGTPAGRDDRARSSRGATTPAAPPRDAGAARGGRVGREEARRIGLDGRTPRRVEGGTSWTIVLGTFTGLDHATAAQEANARLGERIPEFRGSTVKSTATGSMILWGQFSAIDDPNAQRELKRVQALEYRGARPFAKAMLTRPEPTRKPPSGPHDLRNLRRQMPDANPLYTVQIAVWADFDGTRKLEDLRRSAEGYTAQLRARGVEAWYHHDDDLMMSVVTVGAFGADAYNPRSTLFSAEVDAVMRQFPKQLVNGEPLMMRDDPRNPRSPESPQPPLLVEAPR